VVTRRKALCRWVDDERVVPGGRTTHDDADLVVTMAAIDPPLA